MPGQAFAFVSELVVIDHRTGTVQLVASALNDGDRRAPTRSGPTRSAASTACSDDLAQPVRGLARRDRPRDAPAEPWHRTEKADFLAAVERSKEYIRDGDIFQVVISQRFEQEATARPDRRLPGAAQPQPEPVHVPPAPRGHRGASRTGSSAPRPRRS